MRCGLRLDARSRDWARFSAGRVRRQAARRLRSRDADRPIYAAITPARVNDITAAQAMPIEPGATYVFDLGYYDYAWWAKLDAAQCRIVTRLKSNTPLTVVEALACAGGRRDPVRPDRPSAGAAWADRRARNPFQDPVREVRVKLDSGKVLRILSNDLDASGPGDRRSLQAALGDRAVLPLGQADPQNPPLSRHLARTPCASRSPSR